MKQKLMKRLEEINEMVSKKKAEVGQANADLNVFVGHQNELAGLLAAWDELNQPSPEPVPVDSACVELCNKVPESCVVLDSTGEVV